MNTYTQNDVQVFINGKAIESAPYVDDGASLNNFEKQIQKESDRVSAMKIIAADNLKLAQQRAELLEALKGVMYWDNGKSEWDAAKEAIANAEK